MLRLESASAKPGSSDESFTCSICERGTAGGLIVRPEISYLLFHCWFGLDWYDPPCSHSFQDLFGTFAPPAQRGALPRAPFVRIEPGGRAPATYVLLIQMQLRLGGAQNIQTDIEPKSGRTFRRHCSATRFRVRIVCTQTNLKSGTYLKPPFAGPTPRVSPSDTCNSRRCPWKGNEPGPARKGVQSPLHVRNRSDTIHMRGYCLVCESSGPSPQDH